MIDGKTISVTTKVKQIKENTYKVKTTTKVDGNKVYEQVFRIISKTDGTYKLINRDLGIKQVFTDKLPKNAVIGGGSGQSSANGARIDLYDKEYGTPHTVRLYDNYSACATFNQAVFEAIIRPNTIDVTWEASPFYLHYCFVPHEFDYGNVQYGTNTVSLDTQSDRRSSHTFTNTHGGTTYYSVEVDFVYGSW